ncbi:hypothetical protein BDV36DRAFT_275414 [Aspergillus pseudocaelatus]|uniref:Secreted protein n=1 Tax=Aspergillus pseudocaelatus TaxID=1825620 RepID=A0ABQ6W3T1_9EURO|nr:hypothetical protein BDV36DRAFT_275414 [Aspergillus pseudocaelatus]
MVGSLLSLMICIPLNPLHPWRSQTKKKKDKVQYPLLLTFHKEDKSQANHLHCRNSPNHPFQATMQITRKEPPDNQ